MRLHSKPLPHVGVPTVLPERRPFVADAASPDTPTGPREEAVRIVAVALNGDELHALDWHGAEADRVIKALADAGLLSLSGDSTQGQGTVDPDVLAVLGYVSAGRRHVDSKPYPDGRARRALGWLRDEGSLRSEAFGTPVETGEVPRP